MSGTLEPSNPTERVALRSRRATLAIAAGLLLFEAGLLRAFRSRLELNMRDESHYLKQGLSLLGGRFDEVDYAWSLPLSALYAALSRVPTPGWMLPDVMFAAMALAIVVSVWWASRTYLGDVPAVLCAVWLGGSVQVLSLFRQPMGTSVYGFGLVLFALALGFAARRRFIAMLVVLLLMCLNRAETGASLALGGAALIAWPRSKERRIGSWIFALGALFTVAMQLGGNSRARAWVAFQQHFAMGAAERMAPEHLGPPGRSAFDHPEPWVAHFFGDAASTGAAIRANSSAGLEHLTHNAKLLGALLDKATRHSADHLLPGGLGTWMLSAALASAGLVALLSIMGRPASLRATLARVPPVVAALVFGTLALLIPALALRPRADLLVPFGLALGLSVAWLVSGGLRRISALFRARRAHTQQLEPGSDRASMYASVGLPFLLAAAAWLRPSPFQLAHKELMPFRSSANLLLSHIADVPDARLFAADASRLLSFSRIESAIPFDATDPTFIDQYGGTRFRAVTDELEIRFVLLSNSLKQHDWCYPGIVKTLRSGEWTRIEVGERVALFERSNRD